VKKIPSLHQGPKVRAARRFQVCPSSEAQRDRWCAAAKSAGMATSAWLRELADAAVARAAENASKPAN
jgi:hypothetical protein